MIELPRHALDTFTRCPRKFYYRFVLGLEEKTEPDYITIGNYFHGGMKEFYTTWADGPILLTDDAVADLFRAGIKDVSDGAHPELETLAFDMLWYWWQSDICKQELDEIDKVLAIEETFGLIVHDTVIPWTPDVIVRRKAGNLAIIDHKTTGNIKDSLAFLPADPQLRRYALGGWRKFNEIPWLSYNLHSRSLPPDYVDINGNRPYALTKTGRESTRNTDPLNYIRRENMIFTPKQLEATHNEILGQLIDFDAAGMVANYSRRFIKGGSYGCSTCPYYRPCTREFDGNALDGITLKMYYKTEVPESAVQTDIRATGHESQESEDSGEVVGVNV